MLGGGETFSQVAAPDAVKPGSAVLANLLQCTTSQSRHHWDQHTSLLNGEGV
jgi:hypothetical protein